MGDRALNDDLLPGIEAIASYVGEPARRVRWMITAHNFPHTRVGTRIYGRKSWCDQYFAEPANGSQT